MHLVVSADKISVRSNKRSRVIHGRPRLSGFAIDGDIANNHRRMRIFGERRNPMTKSGVPIFKRRRRLRPHNHIDCGSRRFAVWLNLRCPAQWQPRIERIANLFAERSKMLHLLVELVADPGNSGDIQIRLQQHRSGVGRFLRKTLVVSLPQSRRQQNRQQRRKQSCAPFAEKKQAGDGAVSCHQDKGDSIRSRPGRQSRQQKVVDLGVAQLIPGKAGNTRARQFDRDP